MTPAPLPLLAAALMAALLLVAPPSAASAQQLMSEDVSGTQRVCTYAGSDILPNDQVQARTITVGLGQNCPATAPYRDPNAPVPPNARLSGETTNASGRVCTYEQGGVQYYQAVPIARSCAMTPALNGR